MLEKFIVLNKSAAMPSTCWGRYRRVGVVELRPDAVGEPTMLSSRSRQIKRVVKTWEKLNVGSTERCAYRKALFAANQLAAKLNEEVNQLGNKTEWREVGLVPKTGQLPFEIKETRAPWGWCQHHLYRRDQLRPLREIKTISPKSFEASVENIALATFVVNRSAKRYRDAAASCYWQGAHSFAGINKSRKEELYRLKDKGVKRLFYEGFLKCVAKHDKMYLWQGLGYSFHSLIKPRVEPELVCEEALFIEASPPQKLRLRLKDATNFLENMRA